VKKVVDVITSNRNQLVDITPLVQRVVKQSGVESGLCVIYTPHTTAAITINENADPSVKSDIINKLARVFPHQDDYQHSEGNSDAHLKSSVIGCSVSVVIEDGALFLGTWQGIMFCEFDGPRNRRFVVKVLSD
jgi:secondary thiamine-phosphate synthase enzyme